MANAKQKIIIKPGAVHVAQSFDGVLPRTDKSVFSDGYDWDSERSRLGSLLTDTLPVDHAEAAAVEVLLAHEQLLKHHILRQQTRGGGKRASRSLGSVRLDDYLIYTSEDGVFEDVGALGGGEDAVDIHTKQAMRMWEGNNDRAARRWPGVRYCMSLSAELVRLTQRDNPFAHAALVAFEQELDAATGWFAQATAAIEAQLAEYGAAGIHIGICANEDPVKLKVAAVRGYGFKLLQLLMAYDYFVRVAKTLMLKGLMPNHDCNELIREGSRTMRQLLQGLYSAAMRLRGIQGVTRKGLVEDASVAEKMGVVVSQGVFSAVPLDVLLYRRLPQYVFVRSPFDEVQLSALSATAKQFGLVADSAAAQ